MIPFGHGMGYELLHGQDRFTNMRDITNGIFPYSFGDKKIDCLVENLKKCYKEEELKQKVKKINKSMAPDEFTRLFNKKKKSTESSPSGCHIGHYKVVAEHKGLTQLHTNMINIGLMNGVAFPCWKSCVYIMIEKMKGVSKIHRLRIIQLLKRISTSA